MKEENKRKKYYLKRYRNYLMRIERLKEKLFGIDEQLTGLKSVAINDMPSGGERLTTDDLLIKKEETEHRIETLKETSLVVKKEIFECIDHLDDYRLAEILEYYFIDGLTLEEIAEQNNYSVQHVGYLYGLALDNIKIKTLSD